MLLAESNLRNLNHTQPRAALSGHSGCRNRILLGGSYDLRTPMRLLLCRIKIIHPYRWHLSLTSNTHRWKESLTLPHVSIDTMNLPTEAPKGKRSVDASGLATSSPSCRRWKGTCMCTKSLKSCPTPCDPVDCGPPSFSVHGILQARTLEWVAMPSSRRSSQPRDWICVSYVSCIGRRFLPYCATREAPSQSVGKSFSKLPVSVIPIHIRTHLRKKKEKKYWWLSCQVILWFSF